MKTICLLCIGRRELSLHGISQLKQILIHPLFDQVGHFLPTKEYLKMDSGGEIEVQALEYRKIEEVFEDMDSEVFVTMLYFGPINQIKTKIKDFEDQGTYLHGVYRSYFHFLCPEKSLGFPDFVEWCAPNYSSSERVIMDSTKYKILCHVNYLLVYDSLVVPSSFNLSQEYFNA